MENIGKRFASNASFGRDIELTDEQNNQQVSNAFHFKFHRFLTWVKFLIRLPYHVIFHGFDDNAGGYRGYTIKGFIICDCGFVEDLGYSYGMHCEGCYNRITSRSES